MCVVSYPCFNKHSCRHLQIVASGQSRNKGSFPLDEMFGQLDILLEEEFTMALLGSTWVDYHLNPGPGMSRPVNPKL